MGILGLVKKYVFGLIGFLGVVKLWNFGVRKFL